MAAEPVGKNEPRPRLNWRLALAVGIFLYVLALFVAAITSLTGWDSALVGMRSPLPELAEGPALALVGGISIAVIFVLVLFWLSSLSLEPHGVTGLAQFLLDTTLLAAHRRGAILGALFLVAGTLVATGAVLDEQLSPWLWSGGGVLALALLVSGSRRPMPVRVKGAAPGSTDAPQKPSSELWWENLKESPFYRGQVRGERFLSGRSGGPVQEKILTRVLAALNEAGQEEQERLCVLDLPKGAGMRSLIAEVAILQAAGSQRRSLILADTPSRFNGIRSRLTEMIAADVHWSSTIRPMFVSTSEELENRVDAQRDLVGAQSYDDLPHILVINAQGLDALLRRSLQAPWREFFRALGLVILTGVFELTSTKAHHVAYLLRRLELTTDALGTRLSTLIDCTCASKQTAYLSMLLGRGIPPERIIEDQLTRRFPIRLAVWVPTLRVRYSPTPLVTRASFLEEAVYLASDALGNGLRVVLVVHDSQIAEVDLIDIRRRVTSGIPGASALAVVGAVDDLDSGPQEWDVMIYAGLMPTVAEIERDVSLLGINRLEEQKTVALVSAHEATALAFLDRLEGDTIVPSTSLGMANKEIAELHLRALLGGESARFQAEELQSFKDVDLLLDDWQKQKLVAIDTRDRLNAVVPTTPGMPFFNPQIDTSAAGEAFARMVQAGADTTLRNVDAARAIRFAYPGAFLVIGRDRFQAQRASFEPGKTGSAAGISTFELVPSNAIDQVTYPLGTRFFRIPENSKPETDVEIGKLTVQMREVVVSETIAGYRSTRLSDPARLDESAIFKSGAIERPEFQTSALVLSFMDERLGRREALHALAHVLKIATRLHIRCSRDELSFAVIDECSWLDRRPALVAYDDVIGGLGIAADLSRSVLDLAHGILPTALDLLLRCPCDVGCPACLFDPACNEGAILDGLDKLGAIELLGSVLNSDRAYQALAHRTQRIDDPDTLAYMANRVIVEVFKPMLRIEILNVPAIIPTDQLPENVLGLYRAATNAILIRPGNERLVIHVLAHELAHAWTHQGGFSTQVVSPEFGMDPIIFIEGFAQWVETKCLDLLGFEVEVTEIASWGPDPYGIGYRLFAHLEADEKLGGVAGVLRFVQNPDLEWLRGYVNTPAFLAQIARRAQLAEQPPPDWEPPAPSNAPPSQPDAPVPTQTVPDTGPASAGNPAVPNAGDGPVAPSQASTESEPTTRSATDVIISEPKGEPPSTNTPKPVGAETEGPTDQAAAVEPAAASGVPVSATPKAAREPQEGTGEPDLTLKPRTRKQRGRG